MCVGGLYGYGNGERLPKAKEKRHFNAAELMELTGKQLTTNFGLNLAGQVLPLLIGLAAMPYAIRGFGAERFGWQRTEPCERKIPAGIGRRGRG